MNSSLSFPSSSVVAGQAVTLVQFGISQAEVVCDPLACLVVLAVDQPDAAYIQEDGCGPRKGWHIPAF